MDKKVVSLKHKCDLVPWITLNVVFPLSHHVFKLEYASYPESTSLIK